MISSPACLCLTGGASGEMSTRFWIISRPGRLRSWRWRSVRVSPGTCAVVMPAPWFDGWLASYGGAVTSSDHHQRPPDLDGAFRAQLDERDALVAAGAVLVGWKVALEIA